MGYFFILIGFWMLYVMWRGVVPDGRIAWGKSEAGKRMRRDQRLLYLAGAVIMFTFGILAVTRHRG